MLWGSGFIVFLLSTFLFYLQTTVGSDLNTHLRYTMELIQGQRVIPHPGFHYLIILISNFICLRLEIAASLLLGISTSASYFLIYYILKHSFGERYPIYLLVGVLLFLTIVSAIYIPLFNKNIYLGQGTPNIWHSPTWVMMQPFALLCFFLTERCFRGSHRDDRMIVLASITLFVSAFFKPSFALAFIPALVFYFFLMPDHKQLWKSHLTVIALIALPTLVLMGFQYQIKYSPDKIQATSVIFAPFEVWGAKTPSITISALLTLAFPLSVALLYPKSLIEDQGYLLAWLLVLVAFLQRSLLAESGALKSHGNWAWGYFIALKIAFVYSLIILMNAGQAKRARARFLGLIPWAILILHGTSGLIYLHRLFSGKGFY